MTRALILTLLMGCSDKGGSTDPADDTSAAVDDTATPVTSASDFSTGSYRVSSFALVEDNTIGQDIDGDGEVDNKLPAVLSLAAALTSEPLTVGELNKGLAEDVGKGNIILLTDLVQSGADLSLDILLGQESEGTLSVDPTSYDSSGDANSHFSGIFDTQTDFTVSADRAEVPISLVAGEPPVLVPLENAILTGSADAQSNTGLIGGAVPVDAFVDQVVENMIPTGDDYDPADYLDMKRDELIAYIREFASGETVADITLDDGSPAVSTTVQFTAEATTWE